MERRSRVFHWIMASSKLCALGLRNSSLEPKALHGDDNGQKEVGRGGRGRGRGGLRWNEVRGYFTGWSRAHTFVL